MIACILSGGSPVKGGYMKVYAEGKSRLAHRVAYAKAQGVPVDTIKGMVVLHKCDNPPCVNPEHLELGTAHDNMQDMVAKGRHSRLPGKPRKLSDDAVRAIRASDKPYTTGRGFGVTNSVTRYILNGTTYKDVL